MNLRRTHAALFSLALALAALVPACTPPPPPGPDDRPSGPYAVVEGWPRVPEGMAFGPTLAVAVDRDGRVLVAHTAGSEPGGEEPIPDPTIFVFDPESGELLDAWGEGLFVYPHGLAVDADNHVWVTDSEQDRIFKLDAQGNVLMTLGEAR